MEKIVDNIRISNAHGQSRPWGQVRPEMPKDRGRVEVGKAYIYSLNASSFD